MSKAGSAAKVKLSSYDDLFGNAEEKTGSEEQIIRAKLTDLHELEIIRSVYWTMKKWKKQRKASVSMGCSYRELQDRGQRVAMKS